MHKLLAIMCHVLELTHDGIPASNGGVSWAGVLS